MENNNKNTSALIKGIFAIITIILAVFLFLSFILFVSNFNDGALILFCISMGGFFVELVVYCLFYFLSTSLKQERENIKRQEEQQRQTELEKLNHIKKTVILSHATLTDNKDGMKRGIVGMALVGTAGAVIGTSTAKERQTTTFLVVYNDESRETREVENGSELYNIYVQYLDV